MHRVEVFTGTGRRRRWPAEAKAAIVEESYTSGAPVSVVARRHGLIPQQLFTWRRQAREGVVGRDTADMSFAEVIVRDAPGAASTIGIEVGGAVVRVPRGSDPATLVMVLRALRVSAS